MSAAGGYLMSFENTSAIAAAQNDTWTESCWLALVGGSFSNVNSIGFDMVQYPGGTDFATGFANLKPLIDGVLRRFSSTGTLTAAGTANVQPRLQFNAANGQAVDFTLRYARPQMELGVFATSTILTSGSAATRSGCASLRNSTTA